MVNLCELKEILPQKVHVLVLHIAMMGYASFLVLLLVLVQGIASTIRHGQTTTTFNVGMYL